MTPIINPVAITRRFRCADALSARNEYLSARAVTKSRGVYGRSWTTGSMLTLFLDGPKALTIGFHNVLRKKADY